MDIGSNYEFPAGALSNFSNFPFIFEGVECASMEGFLQSLKFPDHDQQKEICLLKGFQAKKRGRTQDESWKSSQTLWWNSRAYARSSFDYQLLLNRAYDALAENDDFKHALLMTGDEVLTHSIGKSEISDTVLTEKEFCDRLTYLRSTMTFSDHPFSDWKKHSLAGVF